MPCNGEYLNATDREIENSRILALIEETKTGKLPSWYGNGYHKSVYNKTNKDTINKNVKKLCSILQKKSKDYIRSKSLELQLWWRDHLIEDEKRKYKELRELKRTKDIKKALSKLTKEERKLLGH